MRIKTLLPEELFPDGVNSLKKWMDIIFEKGPDHLAVAKRHAKRGCRKCGGNGSIATLRRAGATEGEPRNVQICICAIRKLQRKAREMKRDEFLRE